MQNSENTGLVPYRSSYFSFMIMDSPDPHALLNPGTVTWTRRVLLSSAPSA
jgi:hypothetical protein